METIEYRTFDKRSWGPGPWQGEPDKKQWQDETTGYPCLIVRNSAGALCGYVGVRKSHPNYEQGYEEPEVYVHGGLTFADRCQQEQHDCEGICHKVAKGEDDDVWWFGFDCLHAGDSSPPVHDGRSHFNYGEYRDFAYVTSEVASLVDQLKALEP
jgi:hypothetical protein